MAQFEEININGDSESGVNISKIVGFAGANLKEDVLLIQALFKYIADGMFPEMLGLGGDYKVPDVTGEMDADTYSAIAAFQIRNASRLLRHNFDGRIHPASYKNRVIKNISKQPVMTITLLHIMATDAAVFKGDYSYPQALARQYSELATYLDRHLIFG
jgi:hypothetical protein